jgi:hypothetical protein
MIYQDQRAVSREVADLLEISFGFTFEVIHHKMHFHRVCGS